VRKALALTAIIAVGATLLSCSAPQSSTPLSSATTASLALEPIVRAPLPPPVGYASQPPSAAPAPSVSYASSYTGGAGVWQVSPNWTTVEGGDCIRVEEQPQDKLSAQPGTAKFKVKKCSNEEANPSPRPAEEISGH
jgi:hypothetical protein